MKIENQTLNKSTNHSIITKANKKNFFFFFSCYQSLFFFTFLFPFLFSAFFYTAFLLFLYSSWLTTFKLHPLLCFKSMIPSLSLFIFIVRSCFFCIWFTTFSTFIEETCLVAEIVLPYVSLPRCQCSSPGKYWFLQVGFSHNLDWCNLQSLSYYLIKRTCLMWTLYACNCHILIFNN